MTIEATIEAVASEAYGWFTTTLRGEDTITVLKDDAPQWVTDLVHEAHGDGFLPDDWRYDSIRSALESISEGDEDGSEWADGNVDVYTGRRITWLASNMQRASYVDEAVEELGHSDQGITGDIGVGQYAESVEVFGLVLQAVQERVDELESEQEEGD